MLVGATSPSSSSGIPSLSVSLEYVRRELGSRGGFPFPCVYTELYISGDIDAYHSYRLVFLADCLLIRHLEVLICNVILALFMPGHYVFFLPAASPIMTSEFGYVHNMLDRDQPALSVGYARIGTFSCYREM